MGYGRLQGTGYGLPFIISEEVSHGLERDKPHLRYYLPGGIYVYVEYDRIWFCKQDLWKNISFNLPHSVGDKTFIPEVGIWIYSKVIRDEVSQYIKTQHAKKAVVSVTTLIEEVRIRNFQPGDRFYPLGLPHSKKIKDFFIDEKIPRSLRHRIPLIDIGGKIAWVVGYRIDERFKVDAEKSLCIEFRTEPSNFIESCR
jgi:tRNA(Ile)-lysidine synthase